ncbi:MAG TPA: histidine phosphatase family protein [Flavobacterium sp.]|nr:histidine phosphatase family protein [Flavobacterium sp.]
MKQLLLIRHAKSDWSAGQSDRERPLNDRGKRSVYGMAALLRDRIPPGTVVWSSPARRALTTARLLAATLGWEEKRIQVKEDLYTFDDGELESAISECPDEVESLLVFGHNEAITDLVNTFGDRFIVNVPTAGFVHLELPITDWGLLRKGRTITTIFPKEHDIT